MTSSTPPSKNVLRITPAHLIRLSVNSWSPPWLRRILVSIEALGYSCSKVTGNRSRNASLRTLVPIKRPSSLPLPLVFAVATTLNPSFGSIYLPIFFRKTPLPSSTDCRHRILLEARSISSREELLLAAMLQQQDHCATQCYHPQGGNHRANRLHQFQ